MTAHLTFQNSAEAPRACVFQPEFTDEDHQKMAEIDRKLTGEMDPETEFLLFQDQHESMLEDLADLLEQDLDGTVLSDPPPQLSGGSQSIPGVFYAHKACYGEFVPHFTQEIVRPVVQKNGFMVGSINGQIPNVFISEEFGLDKHSYYLMDLSYNPVGRNMWRATKIHKKMDTSAMLVTETSFVQPAIPSSYIMEPIQLAGEHVFDVPMPSHYIGAIIGQGGKNINSLIENLFGNETSHPDVTLTPLTEQSFRVKIAFDEDCCWSLSDSTNLISHMHC